MSKDRSSNSLRTYKAELENARKLLDEDTESVTPSYRTGKHLEELVRRESQRSGRSRSEHIKYYENKVQYETDTENDHNYKKDDPCKSKNDGCGCDKCRSKYDPCKSKNDGCGCDKCRSKHDPCKSKNDGCGCDKCRSKHDPCKSKNDGCGCDDCKSKYDSHKQKSKICDPCDSCKPIICDPCYEWTSYWPLYGKLLPSSPCSQAKLIFDGYHFNGVDNDKRWSIDFPTPSIPPLPCKNLLRLDLSTGPCCFDFNFRFENLAACPTIININPTSNCSPLQLNQFVYVRDPALPNDQDNTNIIGAIAYYNTADLYYNEFTGNSDNFDQVKNLLMSSQLFALHVQHINECVKLTIFANNHVGEDIFKVCIDTKCKVEIREQIIQVTDDVQPSGIPIDVSILKRTVYINGRYFMTYAHYIENIQGAIDLTDPLANLEIPLQIAKQLLFDLTVLVPLIEDYPPPANSLDTDQKRLLDKLAKSIAAFALLTE